MVDLSSLDAIPSALRAVYQAEGMSKIQALLNVFSKEPFNYDEKRIKNLIRQNNLNDVVFQVVGKKQNASAISVTKIVAYRFLSKRAQLNERDLEVLGRMNKKEYWEMTFNLYDSYGNKKVRHKRNQSREEAMQNLYRLRQSPYVKNLKVKHYIEFNEDVPVA